jgi:hypothetical protein
LWKGEKGVRGVPGAVLLVPADVRFKRPKFDVGAGDLMEDPEFKDVLELDGSREGFELDDLSLREKRPIVDKRSAVRRQRMSKWRGRSVVGRNSAVGRAAGTSGSFCAGPRPGIAS